MVHGERTDLLLGTLDLLVLKVLELKPLHGLGVARRIKQVTRGEFQVKPAPSFPPSIVWSTTAGSPRRGGRRRRTGAPATIG